MKDSAKNSVGGLLLKRVALLPGESLIRAGWATYLWAPLLGGFNSRLYLTTKRLLFLPLRFPSLSPSSYVAPLAGRVLAFHLNEIAAAGPAVVRLNLAFWMNPWYVECEGKRYYFSTMIGGSEGWPESIAKLTGIPIGEPRALYS